MKAIVLALLAMLLAFSAVTLFNTTTEESLESKKWAKVAAAFAKWQSEYGKSYETNGDAAYRFAVFAKNLKWIEKENKKQSETEYGVNQFTDLTQEEFAATYLGLLNESDDSDAEVFVDESEPVANDIDWTTKGAVTPVKNQGQCGSCWSFSATGSMEGGWKEAGHSLISMSESNLVDCSSSYGNHGCNGGLMRYAFAYVKDHGIATEASYPYVPRDRSCAQSGKTMAIDKG